MKLFPQSASERSSYIAQAAMIAAIYVILTAITQIFGLASGIIQVRVSEMLTVLPALFPAAVPGLAVGCLLANLLTGCAPWDVLFGTIATTLGALGSYALRRFPRLAALPPIIANTLIIPFILILVYQAPYALPFLFVTVGVGEIISAGLLGSFLMHILLKRSRS